MPNNWLSTRSTGDLLVMIIAITVCGFVFSTEIAIVVLAFTNPAFDTSAAGRVVSDLINTLLGLLAGFLAGRTDNNSLLHKVDQHEHS
jgi:hypothetical protein